MSTVYVLNKNGKPLMPTTRCGRVRHLLKEQKARVVTSNPFTIQLLYETDDVVQPLYLGIDPGRTNIGVAVVKTDGTAVFTAHLETRNKEIPKLMQGRKKARRARRTNGRRCRRQRRAKANDTISKKCVKQDTAQSVSASKRAKKIGVIKRHLPGCEKGVLCIGIKNKEAKFSNHGACDALDLNDIDYDLDDGDRIMVDDSLYDAALDAFDEYDIEYEEV